MSGLGSARPADLQPGPASRSGKWHLREADALAREHQVDPAAGLHLHDIAQRLQRHGANALPSSAARTVRSRVAEQFSDFMVLVLIAAAAAGRRRQRRSNGTERNRTYGDGR